MSAGWLRPGDPVLRPSPRLQDARRVLACHQGQTEVRDRILAFVDAHPDALERTCLDGHLTGSALVVDDVGERVLLHLHAKIGAWLQFGGHCDGDANLAGVALREAREESGIDALEIWSEPVDLDVHTIRVAGEPEHLHLDVRYLARARRGATPVLTRESVELRWFSWPEAARLDLDAGLRAFVETARRVLAGR